MRRLLRHAAFLATLSCAAVQASTAPEATAACADDLSFCDGRCVDRQSHRKNCGECGNACAPGLSCESGRCICPKLKESSCSNACVDTHADPANCGACGVACPSGEVCRDSRCDCGDGARCKGACVSLATDVSNCGACGSNCGSHATCHDGRCLVTLAETEDTGALAVIGDFVYWQSGNALLRVSVQGGPVARVTTSALGPPGQMAFDSANLYWTIPKVDAIAMAPIAGGPSTVLASNLGPLKGGIAVDATSVYFATRSSQLIDTIFAVPLRGGAPRAVFATKGHVLSLAADPRHLFWAESYGVTDGSISHTSAAGAATALVTNVTDLRAIAVRGQDVFWTAADTFAKAPIGGGRVTALATTTGIRPTAAPAVGARSIYWAEYGRGGSQIKRVSIEGGVPTILFTQQHFAVYGLVVDGASLYILTGDALLQLTPV